PRLVTARPGRRGRVQGSPWSTGGRSARARRSPAGAGGCGPRRPPRAAFSRRSARVAGGGRARWVGGAVPRGERDRGGRGEVDVVVADDRDVLWHPDLVPGHLLQDAEGNQVVG